MGESLIPERIAHFKIVSKLMIPRCFSGFAGEDEICRNHCARATPAKLAELKLEIRQKLGVGTHCDSFEDEEHRSCQFERLTLETELVNLRKLQEKPNSDEEKEIIRIRIEVIQSEIKKRDFYRLAAKRSLLIR